MRALNSMYVRSKITSLSALAALSVSLAACVAPEEPSPVQDIPGDCSVPFSREVATLEVRGGHHLYFSVDDFDFLKDPTLQINDILLEVVLRGKHKQPDKEIAVSFNGILAAAKNGEKHCDDKGYDSGRDESKVHFKLHKMQMSGAIPFLLYVSKIMSKKGEIKLSLQGKDVHILSASLKFIGKKYDASDCVKPSPTPSSLPPVAPVVRIDSVNPSGSPVASTSASIAFSADQSGVTFNCALDGASAEPCSSPISYSGLSSGSHSFSVRAVNAAGLDSNVASHSWVVDAVAPSVTIDNLSNLPSVTNTVEVSLSFSGDADIASYECSVDGADYAACASPQSFTGFGEGQHQIRIVGIDGVGNRGEAAIYAWSVDLTAPVVSIVSVDPSAEISSSGSKSIGFAANESATYECSLDGAAFAACESPSALSGLSEGSHSYAIRATDVAGNVGLPASLSWIIDQTAPAVVLGAVQPAQGVTNARQISAEFWSSEAVSFECSLDGAAASACSSPFSADIASEGAHQLQIQAIDLAGNRSAVSSLAWTMDFSAPALSFGDILPSSAGHVKVNELTFNVLSNDPLTNLSASLDGVSLGAVSSPIVLSALSEGAHVLQVTGSDSVGNVSATIQHSFVVDLTAPVVSLASRVNGASRDNTNDLTFSAAESASFECELNGAGFELCESPYALGNLADGQHVFSVRAIDLAGNVGPTASVGWTVDTTAPSVAVTGYQSGTNLVFEVTSNEASTTYTCSLDGAPFVDCNSPKVYSGLSSGAHTLTVRGTDAVGNVDLAGVSATVIMDLTAPTVSGLSWTVTRGSITIRWNTNEAATSQAFYATGTTSTLNRATAETSTRQTSHSVTITGLVNNTVYSVQATGRDAAGNRYSSSIVQIRTSF